MDEAAFHQQALQNYEDLGRQIETLKVEYNTLQKYLETLGLIAKKQTRTRKKKDAAPQKTNLT